MCRNSPRQYVFVHAPQQLPPNPPHRHLLRRGRGGNSTHLFCRDTGCVESRLRLPETRAGGGEWGHSGEQPHTNARPSSRRAREGVGAATQWCPKSELFLSVDHLLSSHSSSRHRPNLSLLPPRARLRRFVAGVSLIGDVREVGRRGTGGDARCGGVPPEPAARDRRGVATGGKASWREMLGVRRSWRSCCTRCLATPDCRTS